MNKIQRNLKIAINPALINKNDAKDKRLFTQGWENVELTPEELAEKIKQGIAYCAQLSGSRKGANFLASDIVSVDIDGGQTIKEALENPIVQKCATLIYTTVSHTNDDHRFRIVFALPRTITNPGQMEAVLRSLQLRLAGDPVATDATRISYGSTDAEVWLLGNEIDNDLLEELILQSPDRGSAKPSKENHEGSKAITTDFTARSELKINAHLQVTLTNGCERRFLEVPPGTSIYCPFHNDRNPSAFVVANKNGIKGIRCSTESTTFWSQNPRQSTFDFYDFERTAKEALAHFEKHKRPEPDLPAGYAGLVGCNMQVVTGKPAPSELQPGVTFIKSPKGSGKTESLKKLIGGTQSVLLIGHRRALITQSCERLDLHCYLDDDEFSSAREFQFRYGICLDSLMKIPSSHHYDIVILDECEQVLSHFLSDTIEHRNGGGRDRLFIELTRLISKAKHVVALDADLSWLSFETINAMADPNVPRHLWLNYHSPSEVQKTIEVYDSDRHLVAELKQALADRKRCFVAANTKSRIESLHAALQKEFPDIKQVVVTSSTSMNDEVKEFINDIKSQAAQYDVILVSPSLGTGVDISFPDKAKVIDSVFGFFDAQVTNHFEFDQQLARVRAPGEIKVWISPRRFQLETECEVVKWDLLKGSLYKNLLIGYDKAGEPKYREDPFINMAALIVRQDRASKNNLKKNFIEHRKMQGYDIKIVEADEDLESFGSALQRLGKKIAEERYQKALLEADPLTKDEFDNIRERSEADGCVSEPEMWSLHRTRLELFYRQKVSQALIELDDRGRLRSKIELFESIDKFKCIAEPWGNEIFSKRSRFIRSKLESAFAILSVLRTTPLLSEPMFNTETVFSGMDLERFGDFVLQHKAVLENLLRLDIRSDLKEKPVQQLSAVLKLIGLKLVKVNTSKVAGQKVYKYKLDPQFLHKMQKIIAARCAVDGWHCLDQLYGRHEQGEIETGRNRTRTLKRSTL